MIVQCDDCKNLFKVEDLSVDTEGYIICFTCMKKNAINCFLFEFERIEYYETFDSLELYVSEHVL